MKQLRIPAAFMRGGTSKAIVFRQEDLPADRSRWDAIFLAALGSPDPFGRQLDGMGGGDASLSKVCVVGPPTRGDADVDYTFVQVQVKQAALDWSGNCGNMSSAIGPFAVDEGLVQVRGPQALVRIHNTNTRKIIWSRFAVEDGVAAVDGELAIPGVCGTGAPVRLEFREPGGATTGRLLPTGNVVDRLDVPAHGRFSVSLVDAANACCFLRAEDLGLTGTELPDALDAGTGLLERLEAIRVAASLAMGITKTPDEARARRLLPFIGFVSRPQDAASLAGDRIAAADVDLTARMVASGQPHRALPLTGSLCMAVAARLEGSVVHAVARSSADAEAAIRIGMPSGVLTVAATVRRTDDGWLAEQGAFYRTQRRLFDGYVYASAGRLRRAEAR
ncbi:MAG TPA: PrpF domain-containing protein [Ramlibacter sp.]|nr:PrpF domain-containing protein [Ramlibacter sp.]